MRKLTYFAVFEPSTDGTFGVYFPDLPGCISMGDNFEHAQGMAAEALGLHLWGMEKDGDVIPAPTQPPFEDVPAGAIIVPVTVFPEVVKNEMDFFADHASSPLRISWCGKVIEYGNSLGSDPRAFLMRLVRRNKYSILL